MGAGANAWAAAWGSSRERARWQEGVRVCVCVRSRDRQRASPYVFALENKNLRVFMA